MKGQENAAHSTSVARNKRSHLRAIPRPPRRRKAQQQNGEDKAAKENRSNRHRNKVRPRKKSNARAEN
jgi:hypothetical protein